LERSSEAFPSLLATHLSLLYFRQGDIEVQVALEVGMLIAFGVFFYPAVGIFIQFPQGNQAVFILVGFAGETLYQIVSEDPVAAAPTVLAYILGTCNVPLRFYIDWIFVVKLPF
jgi:hypothetical protein